MVDGMMMMFEVDPSNDERSMNEERERERERDERRD
jgi:hypothetical protein